MSHCDINNVFKIHLNFEKLTLMSGFVVQGHKIVTLDHKTSDKSHRDYQNLEFFFYDKKLLG